MTYEEMMRKINGKKESLKAALEAETPDADKILSEFDAAISEFSSWSKSNYDKKAAEVRKFTESFSEAGYDPDKHGSLKDYIAEMAKSKDGEKNANLELEALKSKLDSLLQERDQLAKQTLQSKTIDALEAVGIKGRAAKLEARAAIEDGRVVQDGDKLYWKDSDKTMPLDEGIKHFAETDGKEFVQSTQRPGAESRPGVESSLQGNRKLTIDDYANATPDQMKDPKFVQKLETDVFTKQ
jgi:hypothetical protein